jgi:hypothetical protein
MSRRAWAVFKTANHIWQVRCHLTKEGLAYLKHWTEAAKKSSMFDDFKNRADEADDRNKGKPNEPNFGIAITGGEAWPKNANVKDELASLLLDHENPDSICLPARAFFDAPARRAFVGGGMPRMIDELQSAVKQAQLIEGVEKSEYCICIGYGPIGALTTKPKTVITNLAVLLVAALLGLLAGGTVAEMPGWPFREITHVCGVANPGSKGAESSNRTLFQFGLKAEVGRNLGGTADLQIAKAEIGRHEEAETAYSLRPRRLGHYPEFQFAKAEIGEKKGQLRPNLIN